MGWEGRSVHGRGALPRRSVAHHLSPRSDRQIFVVCLLKPSADGGAWRLPDLLASAAERYKPPVGHGINKPASISLTFRAGLDECKLRLALAQQPGVTFESYDTRTGVVAFRVAHF